MNDATNNLPDPDRGAYGYTDAGRYLGVSEGTVRRLVASDELRSFKVGARVLISRVALDDFIRQRENDGARAVG